MSAPIGTAHYAAFSLVELSIVLLILGLLTGGILAGQNLIRAAELRAVTTEFSNYQTAVLTFREKYFQLPGDMTNATDFWGAMTSGTCPNATGGVGTQTCNGDGDGALERNGTGSQTNEYFTFWQHLVSAELLEGRYTGISGPGSNEDALIGQNVPTSKVGNAGWSVMYINITNNSNADWFEGNHGHSFYFGSDYGNTGGAAGLALSPEEAWNIDTKIDDGLPGQGSVISWKQGGTVAPNCATTNAPGTSQYDLQRAGALCSIIFTRAF